MYLNLDVSCSKGTNQTLISEAGCRLPLGTVAKCWCSLFETTNNPSLSAWKLTEPWGWWCSVGCDPVIIRSWSFIRLQKEAVVVYKVVVSCFCTSGKILLPVILDVTQFADFYTGHWLIGSHDKLTTKDILLISISQLFVCLYCLSCKAEYNVPQGLDLKQIANFGESIHIKFCWCHWLTALISTLLGWTDDYPMYCFHKE